jgi:hypothetical protein
MVPTPTPIPVYVAVPTSWSTWAQLVITVLAIALSPVIALWVERKQREKERIYQRRLDVLRSLMSTRASRLSQEHVRALNMIEVEFFGVPVVTDAWKAYIDHLNKLPPATETWGAKRDDLFWDLLMKIARELGYLLNPTDIARSAYFPRGHGELEEDTVSVRKLFVEIFAGKRRFPVEVFEPAGSAQAGAAAKTEASQNKA